VLNAEPYKTMARCLEKEQVARSILWRNQLLEERVLFYCLAAALPLFLMASLFNYSLLRGEGHYLLGANLEILGYIIQAEFLAVASGILILIPLLVQANNRYLRWCFLAIFLVIAGGFAWVAYEVDGPIGMVSTTFWFL